MLVPDMWLIKCRVCLDDKKRPKRWPETCKDCADDIARKHRDDTGHLVDITEADMYEREPRRASRLWFEKDWNTVCSGDSIMNSAKRAIGPCDQACT